ncbi:MAG: diguanylate cyclase [Desulfobacteraceae bacterium]|nr:diguanylate cyclase [Desulfobacteraceae bacterium]
MKFFIQWTAIVVVLILSSAYTSKCFAVDSVKSLKFSQAEQKWLDEKHILRFSEVNWKPLSDVDSFPVYKGIIAEYLNIVSGYTGIEMKFCKSNTWYDVISKFQDNKIDLIPALSVEDDIGAEVLLTEPYITFPLVIATRLNVDFIGQTSELNGKKVGAGRGYTSYFFLKKNYPKIILIQTDDVPTGLKKLEKGEIDAFVGHLAVIVHTVNNSNLKVKIAGKTEFNFEHRMGFNLKNKEAVGIFNKVLSNISKDQHNLIYNQWIKISGNRVNYAFIWRVIIIIVFLLTAAGIFIGYRYYLLNELNQKLVEAANTDVLTTCANRKKLNEELERADYNWQRYKTPFSLLLLDLDNFKNINDSFGHDTGDEVLKRVSTILKNNVRKTDVVGRWGGEEFLIVCTNTEIDGAKVIAQKLIELIRSHRFPGVVTMTASIGIAQCRDKELLKDFFKRIDTALYQAKKCGKNCIKSA